MTFALPDHATLYQALTKRDPAYDGRAFVGVTSTGIFCRLSCPARNPKPENCVFFDGATACLEAGFRPCRRCHPQAAGGAGPHLRKLLAAIEATPEQRWSEADITAMGFDASTMRRAAQRLFGMSVLELARQRRLGLGVKALAGGAKVIDAQLSAGYSSPDAFRTAFSGLMGMAPGRLVQNPQLYARWFDTALGPMVAIADKRAIYLLEFADRKALPREIQKLSKGFNGSVGLGENPVLHRLEQELHAYFKGESANFTVPLQFTGTQFQRAVWTALRHISAGQTQTYSELAHAVGRPQAVRAVGRANGANQIAILVPCHRVIGANGALTGYGGGLWRKERLIELERTYASQEGIT